MKKFIATILSSILIIAFILPASAFSTIAVKSIKLDKSAITLKVGQTYQLNITLTPKNTTQKKLTFVTANKNIASIDAKGKIIGVGKGTTTITVNTSNKKVFANCKVTVTQTAGTTASTNKIHHLKLLGRGMTGLQKDYVKFDEREKFPSWKLFEKQLKARNLELEYEMIDATQYDIVIKTRIATSYKLPDVVFLPATAVDDATALNMGRDGVLIDINSAIDKYDDGTIKKAEAGLMNFAKRLNTAPGNKRYWFSSVKAGDSLVLNNGKSVKSFEIINNVIRKDWLDKLGLPMPTTVDEWRADLKAFRERDANGNGSKDEVLVFDPYSYSFFTGIAQWFGLVPDVVAFDPNSGKVTSPWYQNGVKDYFSLLNGLVKDGVFDTTMIGANDEAFARKVAENNVSALRAYSVNTYWEDLIKTTKDAEYQLLSPLKAKEGITPLMLCDLPDNSVDKYAITKNCKDIEGAIKLFDYVFSMDYYNVNKGIEGVDWNYNQWKDLDLVTTTQQQKYLAGNGGVDVFIQSHFLPRVTWPRKHPLTVDGALALRTSDKAKREDTRRINMLDYRPLVSNPFAVSSYAIATDKELEVINKYSTALTTYSSELTMNLILGNATLDKWDTYIAKLKALGLDKMIEVQQARYDRYSGK
jgi:Bacterial surface proteins containing Ig-like domains